MSALRLNGEAFGESGTVDKYGVGSLTVPYFVEDYHEALFGVLPNETGMGENSAKRQVRPWASGKGYIVLATFEGGGDRVDSEKFFWEFSPSFAERRLESHPRIKDLITKYGGQVQDDGTIFWPLTYSSKSGSTGLNSGAVSSKNPLFGTESYVELQAVFRMVKLRSQPSSDLLERIGKIKKDLPVNVPTPKGRDWLIMPPLANERGNIIMETDEWLLGPPGGWPKDIYELLVI